MRRNNIDFFVTLEEEGEVIMRASKEISATVHIPINVLFELTKQMLENGVARDFISEDILSDIHGLL